MNIKPSIRLIVPSFLALSFSCFIVNAAKYEYTEDIIFQKTTKKPNLFPNNDIFYFNSFDLLTEQKNDYESIIKLINQDKLVQAKLKIESLLKKDPNQSRYYILKAVLELKNGDNNAAKKSYRKSIALSPNNPRAYLGLSTLAIEDKQFLIAKQHANKTLELEETNISAHIVLAKIAINQQNLTLAENHLLNALPKAKPILDNELLVLKLLGQVYKKNNKIKEILPLAQEMVTRNTDNTKALSFLTNMQLANNKLSAAESTLRKIITLPGNDVKYRLALAKLLSRQTGKDAEIGILLDQAAASNIQNPNKILALKVAFLIKRKEYTQALLIAEQIVQSSPRQSIGLISKGDVFFAEKKYNKALNAYQKAYQINKNSKTLDFILKILNKQNKQQQAISLLENELLNTKENSRLQFILANLYQNSNQYVSATKLYEKLLLKQKDNVLILNNLAWVYSQQENPKALELATQAFNKSPNSGIVADTYGYILLKNGQEQKSLKILTQAVKLTPELDVIQLHFAETLIANKNKTRARKVLQQLIDSNSSEKNEATKLLNQL